MGKLKELREFRVESTAEVKVGDKVDVNLFKTGDVINVIGVSKGKGFAGVVKRHGFPADQKHTDKQTVTVLQALSALPPHREES